MATGLREQRPVLSRVRAGQRIAPITALALGLVLLGALTPSSRVTGAAPKFFDDDPLTREPETQDASAAKPYRIDLAASLLLDLFTKQGDTTPNVGAKNVNTIDEVPDSSWFTNRIYATPVSVESLARGPNATDGPAPGKWTLVAPKTSGFAPGFRIRDQRGEVWFLTLDPKGYPRSATGAIAVACRLFWAVGYYQIESHLASFRPEDIDIAETAKIEPRPDYERRFTRSDLDAVLARAHRNEDGTYRVLAARNAPGQVLGGFYFHGTRPDDPNDVVPHEHRRELRALKVFGAWTNLVDVKALNTLDSVVSENGRNVVRHYLQDVGSTFGAGAMGPHDWDEGHEYLYEGDLVKKRLISFGFYLQPWQVAPYVEHPEIGRIETNGFEPERWKTRVPNAAMRQARDDDTFWAALRVAAFTDEMIRAAIREGRYADPEAARMLADVLILRRNKIAQTYLTKITPLTRFALDDAHFLSFEHAAARAGVAKPPANGYRAAWSRFDNATQAAEPIGEPVTFQAERVQAPAAVVRSPDAYGYLKVSLTVLDPAHAEWRPVDVYFRQAGGRWQLVGVERMPD
jgi:hypothetical protein